MKNKYLAALFVLGVILFPLQVLTQETQATPETQPANKTPQILKQDSAGGQAVEKVIVEEQPAGATAAEKITSTDEQIEKALQRSATASDIVGPRPNPEGKPTLVLVSMFIFDISKISDADQTFDTDFRIVYRWYDPRLASDKRGIRQIPIEDIWNPLITIRNLRDFKPLFEKLAFVDHQGHCIYFERYLAKMTVPLNLKDFPRDQHQLFIKARSLYGSDEVNLVIDKALTGWSNILSIPDWSVSNGKAEINTYDSGAQPKGLSQMEFSFTIKRFFGFYFWRIILPLSLIVFMSWGVFWIDPKRLEAQVGLSATSILTLFAFQFAIASLLPKINYLTRMDKFTMMSSLLIFLALIEALLTAFFSKKNMFRVCRMLDNTSRIAFPVAFAGIIYFSFIY